MNTLGGIMFIHNGIKFDYCFEACIESLKACCDQVVILEVGSDDGTGEVCDRYADYKCKIIHYGRDAWDAQQGKEKLAYFQNEAKKYLETEYYITVQADEVISERSFVAVRDAVNSGLDAFMCKRYNLWFDPYHYLSVEQHRLPCSTEVIRLAKIKFDSTGDGESYDCPNVCFDLMNDIELFHFGFVRKPDVMKSKIIHMQEQVFLTPHDAKLDKSDQFDPWAYFDRGDVAPIPSPLPRFIKSWVDERYPNGSVL